MSLILFLVLIAVQGVVAIKLGALGILINMLSMVVIIFFMMIQPKKDIVSSVEITVICEHDDEIEIPVKKKKTAKNEYGEDLETIEF